jgi:hypothetical protein
MVIDKLAVMPLDFFGNWFRGIKATFLINLIVCIGILDFKKNSFTFSHVFI